MRNRYIQILVIFGAISIAGIIIVQVYWIKEALHISESQFDQTVQVALRKVAEKIATKNATILNQENPVRKVNSNNYVVNVNSEIDAEILDYYLRSIFDYYNIDQDIEYGIFNCSSNEMVYCDYIQKHKPLKQPTEFDLPKFKDFIYYFSVSFPNKSISSLHNVQMWLITSVILMIVILFFVFSLFVVFRQRLLSQIQRDFINNMTHEFKTPISTISITHQVISDPDIVNNPQRLSTYSGIVGAEVKRLDELVEKVLNMAKIEKSQFELNKETLHLNDVIRNIVQNVISNGQYEKPNIHLDLKVDDDAIEADKVHFTNIIFNILDNAIKYSEDNTRIDIGTELVRGKIRLSIRDYGPGMNKKEVKKVFDKFYRISTGNVHTVKGFGLGLYYVRKIIDAHRWKIVLESEPGKGSNFIIIIPQKSNR